MLLSLSFSGDCQEEGRWGAAYEAGPGLSLLGDSTQWTSQGGNSSPSEWVVTCVHQEASSPKASPQACQEAWSRSGYGPCW